MTSHISCIVVNKIYAELFNEIYNATNTIYERQTSNFYQNVWSKCFTKQGKWVVPNQPKATTESEMTTNLWMMVDKWRLKGHTKQAGCSRTLKKVFNISVRRKRHSGQIWDLNANPPPQKKKYVYYSSCSFNAKLFCWKFLFLITNKLIKLFAFNPDKSG